MAMLGGWLSAASRESRAVLRALQDLSQHKTPLRVEVEGKGFSYFTVISLRRNALLLARPSTLPAAVGKEDWLRLTLPNRERRQVRVPVVMPHIKVPFSVKHATICGVPDAWSGQCQRQADRFSTTRFKNLYLQLTEPERSFRVVDLSTSGLRILTGPETGLLLFEEGSELSLEHLEDVARDTVPLAISMQESIEGLRRWARDRARPHQGLWRHRRWKPDRQRRTRLAP